jgi:hypothetical protein
MTNKQKYDEDQKLTRYARRWIEKQGNLSGEEEID